MELIEPEVTNHRGTFHDRYCVAKEVRAKRGDCPPWPRLLDCLRCVVGSQDPDYMQPASPGEFCVVDVVTKEKAWFEMPYGATPEIIGAMVTSHFASESFRVGNKLWFV